MCCATFGRLVSHGPNLSVAHRLFLTSQQPWTLLHPIVTPFRYFRHPIYLTKRTHRYGMIKLLWNRSRSLLERRNCAMPAKISSPGTQSSQYCIGISNTCQPFEILRNVAVNFVYWPGVRSTGKQERTALRRFWSYIFRYIPLRIMGASNT